MAAARRMRGVSAVLGPGATRCYLAFVALRRGPISPTYREVADYLGIQINAVAKHVRTFESLGLLTHDRGRGRTFVPAHNSYTPVAQLRPAVTTEVVHV